MYMENCVGTSCSTYLCYGSAALCMACERCRSVFCCDTLEVLWLLLEWRGGCSVVTVQYVIVTIWVARVTLQSSSADVQTPVRTQV